MKCDQIQEIIITDYIDQELKGNALKEIEGHLASCIKCREFLSAVKISVDVPLRQAAPVHLPKEVIWQNIKNQIEPEYSPSPSFLDNLMNNFRNWSTVTRAVSAFAVIALIIAAVVFVKPVSLQVAQNSQEISQETDILLAYVTEEITLDDVDENGYDTMIEEYFL